MHIVRNTIVTGLFLAFACGTVNAQSSSFFYSTYSVQVKYEMWRNGATYWSEVFETNDQMEANVMHDLLESAIEDGSIDDIMNTGFDWIIVDVRVVTEYHYPSWEIEPLWPVRSLSMKRR